MPRVCDGQLNWSPLLAGGMFLTERALRFAANRSLCIRADCRLRVGGPGLPSRNHAPSVNWTACREAGGPGPARTPDTCLPPGRQHRWCGRPPYISFELGAKKAPDRFLQV